MRNFKKKLKKLKEKLIVIRKKIKMMDTSLIIKFEYKEKYSKMKYNGS
jgi:hypothetical protein